MAAYHGKLPSETRCVNGPHVTLRNKHEAHTDGTNVGQALEVWQVPHNRTGTCCKMQGGGGAYQWDYTREGESVAL